jgi:hypothetical protein
LVSKAAKNKALCKSTCRQKAPRGRGDVVGFNLGQHIHEDYSHQKAGYFDGNKPRFLINDHIYGVTSEGEALDSKQDYCLIKLCLN